MTDNEGTMTRTDGSAAAPPDGGRTEAHIYALLTKIFHDILGDDTIVLRPETVQNDVPGWDSFTSVNLIVEVERRFRFKTPSSEYRNLKSAGDFVALIGREWPAKPDLLPGGLDT